MKGIDGEMLLKTKPQELLNLGIFKVTRHHVYDALDQTNKSTFNSQMLIDDIGDIYSINQIMSKSTEFLSSRIFKIEYNQQNRLN